MRATISFSAATRSPGNSRGQIFLQRRRRLHSTMWVDRRLFHRPLAALPAETITALARNTW
jgi:hypothetical protein